MEHNQNELKSASQIETGETSVTGKVWKKPELRILSIPSLTQNGKANAPIEAGKNTTIYRPAS